MKDISDYVSRKLRNKTKQISKEQFKDKLEKQGVNNPDRFLKLSLKLTSRELELDRKGKQKTSNQILKDIIMDKLTYKNESFLDKYSRSKDKSFYVFQYRERTKELRIHFGKQKVNWSGKEISLNEMFRKFANNEISQNTLNKFIKKFKRMHTAKFKEGSK